MGEKAKLTHKIDIAVVKILRGIDRNELQRKTILKKVNMAVAGATTGVMEKRIKNMLKNGYLIKPCRGIYKLNPEIDFEFIGEPVHLRTNTTSNISEKSRGKHTEDLKKIIQNWIEYFPHPSSKYPTDEHVLRILNGPNEQRPIAEDSSDLACNFYIHPLFSDLKNHLSTISDVCEKFENYKINLKMLSNLKMELYNSIKAELKSYCDIPEIKSFDRSHLGDYCKPYSIEVPIYSELFILQSPQKFWGGDEEDPRFQIVWENETYDYDDTIYNNQDRILFIFPSIHRDSYGNVSVGDSVYYALNCTSGIENHKGTYDYLCKVKDNFLNGDIWSKSELVNLAKNISIKSEELQQMEFEIVEELRRILHYAIFPGDCEYLCV